MSQNIKYAKNLQLSGDTEKDNSTASSFSVEREFLLTLEADLTCALSVIAVLYVVKIINKSSLPCKKKKKKCWFFDFVMIVNTVTLQYCIW